jgi:hypothetical protein
MCRELEALRQSVCDYARSFDAGALIPAQAAAVVQACSAMESSMSAVKALAAAVVEAGGSWKGQGYRSPEEQLADWTGTGTSSARRSLEAGRRMAQQPEVAHAALAGRLSPEQTALVADGAAANGSKARELIERAHQSSLGELRNQVAQIKADACDQEARRQRIHAARKLRRYRDADGVWHLFASGNVEDGIGIARLLEPIRQRLDRLRRDRGDARQTYEQLDYDALVQLSEIAAGRDGELTLADLVEIGLFGQLQTTAASFVRPEPEPPCDPHLPLVVDTGDQPARPVPADPASETPPGGPARPRSKSRRLAGRRTQLTIRVDLGVLMRGVPLEGELCDIPGYGPVPVSVIEDLVASGNTLIAGLLTNAEQIIGVRHFGRRPTRAQQTALDFIYPHCAVKGCSRSAGLEYDHRLEWQKTHFTVYDLIDRLCWYHHQQKTHHGWALVDGRGKRSFVPPTDPRPPTPRAAPTRVPARSLAPSNGGGP